MRSYSSSSITYHIISETPRTTPYTTVKVLNSATTHQTNLAYFKVQEITRAEIITLSLNKPVAVVNHLNQFQYYLYGQQIALHRFKKYVKQFTDILIIKI